MVIIFDGTWQELFFYVIVFAVAGVLGTKLGQATYDLVKWGWENGRK